MAHRSQDVQVWGVWLIAVLVTMIVPVRFESYPGGRLEVRRALSAGAGVMIAQETPGQLFPWLPNYGWRKMA